ncbi:MAG: hypothetical protein HYZ28_28990 [Myxococcales bacterium]|nr:hypothetical protein [Myxococcales bacterium]
MSARAGRRATAFSLLLAACATTAPAPPAGDELEHAEDADPSSPARRKVFDRPPTDDDALAAAFEPERDRPVPPSPAMAPVAPVAPEPPVVDDRSERRAAFAASASALRQLIASGKLEDAREALDQLGRTDGLEPDQRQQVAELELRLAEASNDAKGSRRAAERWLLECGPEKTDACRARALAALSRAGKGKGAGDAARERAAQVRAADDCLSRAETAKGWPPPGCLEGAIGTYRRLGDRLMVARAHLAKGLAAAAAEKDAEAATQLGRAAKDCEEPRCASIRRRALKRLGWHHLRLGDPQQAVRAMLSDMKVHSETLPREQRLYARTSEVDQACAALDGKEGAGACRRLELALNGSYALRDYSAEKSGTELSPEKVREVNEHFSVMMQDCLALQAERLVPPAWETYVVRWAVNGNGRVEQVHLGQKEQEASPLADCLRRQFALWRYPRYEGELQHVEQSFTVNARERRVVNGYPR